MPKVSVYERLIIVPEDVNSLEHMDGKWLLFTEIDRDSTYLVDTNEIRRFNHFVGLKPRSWTLSGRSTEQA